MYMENAEFSHGRQLLLQRSKSRALSCLIDKEYGRAFAHFIVAFTVDPDIKSELLNAFLFTIESLTTEKESMNEVIMVYEQALEVLPYESHILHGLATSLFRRGYLQSALSYFLKSYEANPYFTPSLYCMENLKNALIERWHFRMLNDVSRNTAYLNAIKKAVSGGFDRVVDIGAGTGIFSMMAADSGAKSICACESSEIMFAILQNVIKANEKTINTVQKSSDSLSIPEDLPEKANLVVTEIFDAGLFGEHCLQTLNHAWEYLLERGDSATKEIFMEDGITKPIPVLKAKVIPHSARVYVVPVECEYFRKFIGLTESVLRTFDIKGNVVSQHLEEPYNSENVNCLPGGYKMLSAASPLMEVDFNSANQIKALLRGEEFCCNFDCVNSGNLDALLMWFELYIDEEEVISTAPSEEGSCCWEQAVFYVLPRHLEGPSAFCNVGDSIEVNFLCKGHLRLQRVKLSNCDNPLTDPTPQITIHPSTIHILNAYASSDILNLNLKDLISLENKSVLDISTFPVLGLKSLREGCSTLMVLRTQYMMDVEKFASFCTKDRSSLKFKMYEDFCRETTECDVLIVDPVETCGLLKKNVLEDVAMLKMRCMKDTGVIIPGQVSIFATLVESPTLREYSHLVSDDRVASYKISQIMNVYKCRIHQDIQLSTLPHKKLSEPIKLCTLNFNDQWEDIRNKFLLCNSTQSTSANITQSGLANAVVYWFSVSYSPDCVLDTYADGSLFKQAACLLEDDLSVTKGQNIDLNWSLKSSCFLVGVSEASI